MWVLKTHDLTGSLADMQPLGFPGQYRMVRDLQQLAAIFAVAIGVDTRLSFHADGDSLTIAGYLVVIAHTFLVDSMRQCSLR